MKCNKYILYNSLMGGWIKPLPKIKAMNDNSTWINKSKHMSPPTQSLSKYTVVTLLLLYAVGSIQYVFTTESYLLPIKWIVLSSYIYCDFWLWLLHCFLDRKENLESNLFFIKISAFDFQEHHDIPAKILTENHLSTIDEVIMGTAGTTLLFGYFTGPVIKLFSVGVCVWGSLGCVNHFYCHCITHGKSVPLIITVAQRMYLLPTSKHHKIHHTVPYETNWNFLVGGHLAYEWLYKKSNHSYKGLAILFYTLNPVMLQIILYTLR